MNTVTEVAQVEETAQPARKKMSDTRYVDYIAATISHLSVIQQQRIMARLVQLRRVKQASNQKDDLSEDFDHRLVWQQRVRLSREARMKHLIRAFMKGQPYKEVEASNKISTVHPVILRHNYTTAYEQRLIPLERFKLWLAGK